MLRIAILKFKFKYVKGRLKIDDIGIAEGWLYLKYVKYFLVLALINLPKE